MNFPKTAAPSKLSAVAARVGFRLPDLLPSAALAASAAFFEAASLALLLPATRAALAMDLGLVRESSLFRSARTALPSLGERSDSALFLLVLAAMLAAVLLKLALSYLSAALLARQAHTLATRLREALFEQSLRCGKLYFDQANSGHIQHIITSTPDRIASQLIVFQDVLASLFLLGAYLLIMARISWPLTLAFVLLLPAIHRSGRWLDSRVKESSRALAKAREALNSHVANAITGIQLVKSYSSEEWEKSRFAAFNREFERHQADIDRKGSLVRPVQEAVFLVLMVAFLLALPFISPDRRGALLPGLLVFVYLARRASISLMLLGRYNVTVAALEGPLDEALQLLEDGGKHRVPDGEIPLAALQADMRFKGLSFSFPGGPKVLRGVDFLARRGEMTAVVGPSGAGKTTLFNLLLRFYDPPPGTVLLDGRDIRGFTQKSLSSLFALVGQETMLLNDSLRNNLCYAMERPLADDALLAVLGKAHLLEFVRRQPRGLDTVIGDRGVKLSGGERQRLSVARAMLKGAEVLLLDEATSALDSETETLVQQSIESLLRGKTSLVIAHRLSTIKNADKIVVLEDGVVREEGTLDSLLASAGTFRRYWDAQRFRS